MKSSYSQNSTYTKCPMHWMWRYKEKIESQYSGASTFFGSAIDAAVESMLKGNLDCFDIFAGKWYATIQDNKTYPIYDNPNIIFAHSDFDEYVFDEIDKDTLKKHLNDLGLIGGRLGTDPIAAWKEASKLKKNPYKQLSPEELVYFNRCCWLSLRNKGRLLLEGFKTEFLPRVEKVLATQQYAHLKDEATGDSMSGVIDMVVKLKGYDKPIIFDLKTASRPYEDEDIDITEQLSIYCAMKGQEYQTNLVGYVVLVKQLQREEEFYCKDCGHKKDNRSMKCDAIINDKRCSGEWVRKVKLTPQVQIMIREKTPEEIQSVMIDQGNILFSIKSGIVYKNRDNCDSWFGSTCPYKGLCYKGEMGGLHKKGENK